MVKHAFFFDIVLPETETQSHLGVCILYAHEHRCPLSHGCIDIKKMYTVNKGTQSRSCDFSQSCDLDIRTLLCLGRREGFLDQVNFCLHDPGRSYYYLRPNILSVLRKPPENAT